MGQPRHTSNNCAPLARIRAPHQQAVPLLTGLLRDPAADVRMNAVIGLAGYAGAAQSALPALRLLEQDPEARIAAGAAAAVRLVEGRTA